MKKPTPVAVFSELLEAVDNVETPIALDGLANALERVLHSGTVQDRFGDELVPVLELIDEVRRLSEQIGSANDGDNA